MKKIVLTFGILSGLVVAVMLFATLPLVRNGTINFENGQILGYSSMILAFLLVFFGVRTYREREGRGVISFGRAFKVGILITLISCAMYVVAWEIYYYNFAPDFVDKYITFHLDKMRADGATAAAIAAEQEKMAKFQELYRNPAINVGMTFLEIFPVGLIMTLIAAAILRKKEPAVPDEHRVTVAG